MSVIVRGMEMPKHCIVCVLINAEDDCMAQEWQEWETWEEMRKGCPLVELPKKHGRLIDGDELKTAFPACDNSKPVTVACVRATINHMPTVIGAEGSDQ